MNAARKEHQRCAKELLAATIVSKAIEIEVRKRGRGKGRDEREEEIGEWVVIEGTGMEGWWLDERGAEV